MNAEQFENSWDQLKNALKEHWMKFTDEDFVQIAGDQRIFKTIIHTRYGPMQEHVRSWADRWYARRTGWYEGYVESTHSLSRGDRITDQR